MTAVVAPAEAEGSVDPASLSALERADLWLAESQAARRAPRAAPWVGGRRARQAQSRAAGAAPPPPRRRAAHARPRATAAALARGARQAAGDKGGRGRVFERAGGRDAQDGRPTVTQGRGHAGWRVAKPEAVGDEPMHAVRECRWVVKREALREKSCLVQNP